MSSTGGFGTFHALLNSFIHFWMYIYYGVAALGPQYRKYLWWKKYMTTLQIVSTLIKLLIRFRIVIVSFIAKYIDQCIVGLSCLAVYVWTMTSQD